MSRHRTRFAGLLLLPAFLFLALSLSCSTHDSEFEALRVAHAGGGIHGETYTNSYDALDLNLGKGFTYFEIDFSFTRDGELVCIHDWDGSYKRSFGLEPAERPDLATFETLLRTHSKYKKCTLSGLSKWMRENPAARLVTDVKRSQVKALAMISEKIPDSGERVIPQIYQPEEFDRVKEIGFRSIIWTLYLYGGTDKDVLAWTERFKKPFAIAMSKGKAATSLPRELAKKGIPTYVHTVNEAGEVKKFRDQYGVTEIYTDFLAPENERLSL